MCIFYFPVVKTIFSEQMQLIKCIDTIHSLILDVLANRFFCSFIYLFFFFKSKSVHEVQDELL